MNTSRAPKAQGENAKSPLVLEHRGRSTDMPMYHGLDLCHVSYSKRGSVNVFVLVEMVTDWGYGRRL